MMQWIANPTGDWKLSGRSLLDKARAGVWGLEFERILYSGALGSMYRKFAFYTNLIPRSPGTHPNDNLCLVQ